MRIALLCFALLGCATLQSLTTRPTATFKEVRVDRVDFDGADVAFVYIVQSQGSYDLSSVSYELDVEGHALAAGRPPNGFHIPPGQSEIAFPARVVWTQVLPALQSLATMDVVHYRASGTLGVGPFTFPLEHEGTLPTPKLPELSLQPPRLVSINPLEARLSIPLHVVNRNAFPLPIAGIFGDLRVSGFSVGKLALPAQGVVEAGKDRTVEIPVEIGFLSAGAAVARAIQSNSIEVEIEGALTIGAAQLPVHLQQTLQVQRQ
jgi:LEA14-like dessication related protein